MQVSIIDARPEWMIREDMEMACFYRCPLYRKCSTRMGYECRRFGGEHIPRIRG